MLAAGLDAAASADSMTTPNGPDVVQQATQLLTLYLHCRKESEGLQACHAQHGAGSQDCTRHHAAFNTCAKASMMQIVDGLVKIADKFCAEEVAAFQRCKQQGFGDEACESFDLAALQASTLCTLCTTTAPPLHHHCNTSVPSARSAPSASCGSVQAAGCSTLPVPRLARSIRRQVRRKMSNEP